MAAISAFSASDEARQLLEHDGSAVFAADWTEAVFMHFAIDPAHLAPHVPLELDTRDGRAYVSLVAFTQRNLRPIRLGRLGRMLSFPVATHAFLNLRTYVRHGDDRGIFFLAEWIPNIIARLLGPATYGLPFHLARLNYATKPRDGKVAGSVSAGGAKFAFSAKISGPAEQTRRLNDSDSLDPFLVERYCAFTATRGGQLIRRFRIHHAPWPLMRADFAIECRDLIRSHAPWFADTVAIGGHYSAGVNDIQIGQPMRI